MLRVIVGVLFIASISTENPDDKAGTGSPKISISTENPDDKAGIGSPKIFGWFIPPAPATSVVIPTSATIEHHPGVPPGWPTPETPQPPRRQDVEFLNNSTLEVSSTTGYPYVLNPNFTQPENLEDHRRPDRGFIDWLLNLFNWNSPFEKPENVQPPKDCPHCTCGLTYKHKRIVGGVETQVNAYPWMVTLLYNNRFYCGASLINNKYLLTAAHCVNGFTKERLSAVFLDHDRSNHFETETFTRSISRILRHRYYANGGAYNNDIALLKLDMEVPVTGLLKPVCLPTIGKSFTGYKGVAVGWGATQVHGQVSNTLREVEVPIMSNIECRKTGYGNKITDNMICAGLPTGMKDACQGDSGGPLHILNGTYNAVVGVVSWGEGCAEPNYPGVYTRVNRYVSWIKSNTRDACYCDPYVK